MNNWMKDKLFYYGSYSRNSGLLFKLNMLRPSIRKNMVHKDSDICIEGFQRSGNTYFELMFRQSNPGAEVAHHLHSTEHIKLANKLDVPVVLLIREPLGSLASLITYDERLSPTVALSCYVHYYSAALKIRSMYCLVPFQQLISNFNEQIEKINGKFDSDFQMSMLSEEGVKNLMAHHQSKYSFIRSTPFPNAFKKERNQVHKGRIEQDSLYPIATSLYDQFMMRCV